MPVVGRGDEAADGVVRGGLTSPSLAPSFGLLPSPADPASHSLPCPGQCLARCPIGQSGFGLSLHSAGPTADPQLLAQLLLLTAGARAAGGGCGRSEPPKRPFLAWSPAFSLHSADAHEGTQEVRGGGQPLLQENNAILEAVTGRDRASGEMCPESLPGQSVCPRTVGTKCISPVA